MDGKLALEESWHLHGAGDGLLYGDTKKVLCRFEYILITSASSFANMLQSVAYLSLMATMSQNKPRILVAHFLGQ
jgi:hypothetical protein